MLHPCTGGRGLRVTMMSQPAVIEALWRAMPAQRLLDCGMLYGDVLHMQYSTQQGESWDYTAEALGDSHASRAQAQLRDRYTVSAGLSLRAATAGFQFAQMPLPDGERKRHLYRRIKETLGVLTGVPGSGISRVELPFEHGTMVGWTVIPEGGAHGAVVVFGGQSGWGSCYARAADALAARGIATVLAEGPGQGESRLFGGLYLDCDVAAAYSRFIDVASGIAGGGRLGIWGNSMGGLFAALTAARDARIAACCVNSGFATPRLLDFRTFREQAGAMLGTNDPAAIQANFDRLAFDPSQDHIEGELLVIHGGADPMLSLEDQQPFLRGAAQERTTLKIWERGDHTIYNHGDERNAYVTDWFLSRLCA